ncbi:MAG TPA: SAF domain-containing protein [Microlunatus sp.]|nr:SAF domain-containing protein [Microlunatus sp.]
MTRTSAKRPFLHDLGRALSWHRRKIAVIAAVAAVLTGISAARSPAPPTLSVVRAVRQLSAGQVLSAGDLRTEALPRSAVPAQALTDPDAVVGSAVNAPIAADQVLTELDLGVPRASGPGLVVAPLRLADARVAGLLRVGDRVDVIAARDSGPSAVVAHSVLVVGLPAPADGGALAGDGSGPLVLVEVDLATATRLDDTGGSGRLTVVLR